MNVLTVIGARPQFVKAAPLSQAFLRAGIKERIVHTGQHYDRNMSAIFFQELEMRSPDIDLGIGSGGHGQQTGQMLIALEPVMIRERPAAVVVFGDTNSTLAGALAAAKLHIPIAHVEAGLRSFNTRMPEELNRVVADHLSSLLLVPTSAAEANLLREGIPAERIHIVGDVMYDAAMLYGDKAERTSGILGQEKLKRGAYVLVTIHRPDNVDDPVVLGTIVTALNRISENERVVFPIHPRTRASLSRYGLDKSIGVGVSTMDAIGYLDMLMLEKNARVIVTDSGGIQKEAFFFRVPCVTLRAETEWVELVAAGWNTLIPALDVDSIVKTVREASPSTATHPTAMDGDGHASDRIVNLVSALAQKAPAS
jgi:UDP-GlcNAc3NAcA epimerase